MSTNPQPQGTPKMQTTGGSSSRNGGSDHSQTQNATMAAAHHPREMLPISADNRDGAHQPSLQQGFIQDNGYAYHNPRPPNNHNPSQPQSAQQQSDMTQNGLGQQQTQPAQEAIEKACNPGDTMPSYESVMNEPNQSDNQTVQEEGDINRVASIYEPKVEIMVLDSPTETETELMNFIQHGIPRHTPKPRWLFSYKNFKYAKRDGTTGTFTERDICEYCQCVRQDSTAAYGNPGIMNEFITCQCAQGQTKDAHRGGWAPSI